MIIDASGDADIIKRAGVPTVEGDNWLSFMAQCIKKDFIKEYYEKNENANVLIKNHEAGSETWGKGQPEGQAKLKGLSAENVTDITLKGREHFLKKLREMDQKVHIVTQLPYRTLYNKDFPNILCPGRIVSAYDDGWEITGVIPVCALAGEAAGYVASISIDDNVSLGCVDVSELQE